MRRYDLAAAAAWRRWREYLGDMAAARGALRWFVHRALFASWRRWLDYVEECRRARRAAAVFARRALHTVRAEEVQVDCVCVVYPGVCW